MTCAWSSLERNCRAAQFSRWQIAFGVEYDDTPSGIQRADLETWVMDTVFGRYVHPLTLPFYEEVVFDDGKRVAVIPLTRGTAKPYMLRNNNREEI